MIFPSFYQKRKPAGNVHPDILAGAQQRQADAARPGGGGTMATARTGAAGQLIPMQDKATIAAANGDPNALEMAQQLEKQKRGVREAQLTADAEAEARIKAKAQVAGDAVKSAAEQEQEQEQIAAPGSINDRKQRKSDNAQGVFFRPRRYMA